MKTIKNNLELFRTEAGMTPKQLSLLLNMSVHTYNAIERNRIPMPPEIGIMLAIIYSVTREKLTADTITLTDLNGAHQLIGLDACERFEVALYALTGSKDRKNLYRRIKETKFNILSCYNEKNNC